MRQEPRAPERLRQPRRHPAVAPLVRALRPLVRGLRAAATPLARPLRRRLWRLGPGAWWRTLRWAAGIVRRIAARRRDRRLSVAVDADAFWEPLTGVGWYLYRLVEHLARRDDLVLRLYGGSLVRAPGVAEPEVALPEGPAVERVVYEVPDGLSIPRPLLVRWVHALSPLLLAADGNDVAFAPNYLLPPRFRWVRAPLVATVHDLAVRRVPWAVRPDTAAAMRRVLDRTLFEADRLITPSRAVRDELIAGGEASPARVHAIHHGLGQAEGPANDVEAEAGGDGDGPDPERRGVGDRTAGRPYVLAVGTLEPRKNLSVLIEAVRRLQGGLAEGLDLVLVGRFGWRAEGLRREVAAGTAAGWLRHSGYVSGEELARLYRGALLVALPSLYEGFGLPAVEAMAAEVPVVLSDIPVFHEVAGDAALYAPPDDPDAWAERISRLAADPDLRRAIVRSGRERARRYTWERSAEEHARVFRLAARRARAAPRPL